MRVVTPEEIYAAMGELAKWLERNPPAIRSGTKVIKGLAHCAKYEKPIPEVRVAVWNDLAEMAGTVGRSDRLTSVMGTTR